MLLQGKTAIITGGAGPRGIGFATAKTFVAQGGRVAILDLDGEGAKRAAAELGDGHIGLSCNVTDRADCQRAVDEVLAAFGHLDILINNAGITQPVKVWDISEADWQRIQDVNLKGVLFMSQAVMPHMKSRHSGSIACMSSVSAQRGGGILGGAHYSAAKAMARELGNDNVRVNCVAPGLIKTDINAGKISDENMVKILEGIPLNRLGVPQDVANIFLFLASDLSAYLTGNVIDVNGGMLIH